MILKMLVSRFSSTFSEKLQLISFFFKFSVFFGLIDQAPIIFFRFCRYYTGAISETKIGVLHIFEIGLFKEINFCLRGKSLRVLALSIFLFSLLVLVSQFFEMILFFFGWHFSIYLLVR